MLAGAIVSLLSPPLTQPTIAGRYQISVSINLANSLLPHSGDSETLPTQFMHLFQQLLLTSGYSQHMLWNSLNSLKGPQSPKKQQLASVWPIPLARQS